MIIKAKKSAVVPSSLKGALDDWFAPIVGKLSGRGADRCRVGVVFGLWAYSLLTHTLESHNGLIGDV